MATWFASFSELLRDNPNGTSCTLATVDASVSPPVPRVRNIVPRVYIHSSAELPLIVSATDVRTPKVRELVSIPSPSPNAELCWWVSDANEQWRIAGRIHVLPRPGHPFTASFPAQRLAPRDGFDWEEERMRIFNEDLPATLRAWFARPAPGSDLESYDDVGKWPAELPGEEWMMREVSGDEETRAHVREAVRNFALMVMEPSVVERVQLGVMPHRRTRFERNGEAWSERIVFP